MTKNPLVSIIIVDYRADHPYLKESLQAIKAQTYSNYEIILVSDYKTKLKFPKLKHKTLGKKLGPALKRDLGAKLARGEILAFLDDDAFPAKDWLKNLIPDFTDPKVAAVGGPGITPPKVSWQEAASGWVSASPLGAGPYGYRFLPQLRQEIDDFPSMNLSVRKTDFLKVGGYDSHYYPGEDTKLCLDLTHKLKKKIIYEPRATVFHHRRPLWLPHLKQNGNFGLHRGYFARILPQTSLRLSYLLPSLMVIGLIFLLSTKIYPYQSLLFKYGWYFFYLYLGALLANAFWITSNSKSLFQGLISVPAVFLTHFWYGLRFLQGFFLTQKL